MKKILFIMAGLVLLPALVLLTIVLSLDVNRFKPELVELGRQLSGREFDIRGDIHLKPALIPTLVVEGVRLGNADWATHGDMLEVQRFEGRLRLLPLLRHEIRIRKLILSGANIVLERHADGRGNWALGQSGADGDSAAPYFDLEEVSIRNSRVEYHEAGHSLPALTIDSMSVLPEGPGQSLRLRSTLNMGGRDIDLGARLDPLPRLFANEPYALEMRFSARELRFELNGSVARPHDVSGLALTFSLSAPMRALLPKTFEHSFDPSQMVRGAGEFTDEEDRYVLRNLQLQSGQSDLAATVTIEPATERPRLVVDFTAAHLDLTPLMAPSADKPAPDRLFATTPFNLQWLGVIDAQLAGTVGELRLPELSLESVRVEGALEARRLMVDKLTALIDNGTLAATVKLDASDEIPRVQHTLNLQNISMSPLVSTNAAKQFRGGHVDLGLEIDGRGASMAAVAGTADGHVSLSITEVDIANRGADFATGDLLLSVFSLLNPLARRDSADLIECAVFNFPLKAGRAEAATGIGIRTSRLNILGGGAIDLDTEMLDIGVNPKPREGIGLNLAGFADFIRIGGTLLEPAPKTDAAGVVTAGLKGGAAIATGGLSLLAEGLLDRAQSDVDVCAVAAGRAQAPAAQDDGLLERAAASTGAAVKGAGAAVSRTFKRLFSD